MEKNSETELTDQTNTVSTEPQSKTVNTQKSRPRRRAGIFLIALALLAGFVGSWLEDLTDTEFSSLTTLNNAKDDGNKVISNEEESIASVAREVAPSVVSILTSSSSASQFYNRSVLQEGAGTGMIVSKDGYILTNKHVVNGADAVSVVMQNGKVYKNVKVLGSDPLNDVAFLKLDNARNLPAVTLGDSKTVRIGQSVVAIGNALGQYQNSVTSGIISGTGRPVVATDGEGSSANAESLSDLLQTDAAINSGNSGGPLLNVKGQVIGINTAIAEDAQGIGFAIPIGATKGMLNHLVETGKLERAYLGVQYVPITPEIKDSYNLSTNRGDYITSEKGSGVLSDGPADKAGIKDGDIITKVNGYTVGEVASVSSLISEFQPGDTVEVTILRDGKSKTIRVTLGTYKN